jgi:hypothetical protein
MSPTLAKSLVWPSLHSLTHLSILSFCIMGIVQRLMGLTQRVLGGRLSVGQAFGDRPRVEAESEGPSVFEGLDVIVDTECGGI